MYNGNPEFATKSSCCFVASTNNAGVTVLIFHNFVNDREEHFHTKLAMANQGLLQEDKLLKLSACLEKK